MGGTGNIINCMFMYLALNYFPEPDAVALLTRLAGKFSVKDPKGKFHGVDLDPPSLKLWRGNQHWPQCLLAKTFGVETFGMISENSSPS
jgi:hypothetical protein